MEHYKNRPLHGNTAAAGPYTAQSFGHIPDEWLGGLCFWFSSCLFLLLIGRCGSHLGNGLQNSSDICLQLNNLW